MMKILRLKKSNCKNCYKCIRECPVKSIRFADHQAHIINEECILCGKCVVSCPQNAKSVISEIDLVKDAIAGGKKVVASVAPSFISEFNVSGISEFETSLQQLGFHSAEETATGAYIVKSEYERLIAENSQPVIISTCCTSIVRLVQKYYPRATKYLAHVLSPMQVHARQLKFYDPNAFVVFIGPCIAKKSEIQDTKEFTDVVMTFEELKDWASVADIPLETVESPLDDTHMRSRFFPKTGGIIKSMNTENSNYKYFAIDGVKRCMTALESILNGDLTNCFIEMSACAGSCINGPSTKRYAKHMLKCETRVENYATCAHNSYADFDITWDFSTRCEISTDHKPPLNPGKAVIDDILSKMGKTKPEHELNCGTCGYATCRDKAFAVHLGKADITMCLPYMKERAESFSDIIINNTPNAIMVLDSNLIIQQLNDAACVLFHISTASEVIGKHVITLVDASDYVDILNSKKPIVSKTVYLSDYEKYVEQSIIYNEEHDIIINVLKDISSEHKKEEQLKELRYSTAAITDKVIDKQMTTVQEIASLLGETVAETKIALTNLKSAILAGDKRNE